MEVVAWVIEKQARRYDREIETGGQVSEGLAIAHKLDKVIDKIKITNDFKNIKLPITPKERAEFIKSLPQEQEKLYRYSWLHDNDNRSNMYINQGM